MATIVESLAAAGVRQVRLLDAENGLLLGRLQAARLPWGGRVRNIVVSRSRGSNFDAFKSVAVDDLASLIVDVLHAGVDPASLREAGRVKQRLLEVAAHLDEEPKTLPRLRQAVRFALTGQPPAGASYTPDEETRLLDYHNVDVRNRRDLADSLDKLADDLSTLAAFGPAAGK